MVKFSLAALLASGALLGCSHAAHVRDGRGCVDSKTVVLAVPADRDVPPATWLVELDTPLEPGQTIRISDAKAAEYREGGATLSFASVNVDGILGRLADQDGSERYVLKAVANDPTIDVQSVGRRGVEGRFSAQRQVQCR